MTNSAEELDIIKTVLEYTETGTTHMEPEVMLNPTLHYTDPERLNQEVDILFRKFPIIVGSSAVSLYTSPSPRDQRGSRMPSSA